MVRRLPLLAFVILLAALLVGLAAPALAAPPAPVLDATGDIWWGSTPPGGERNPVLVFVHGLHGTSPTWWGITTYSGINDMYLYAYNAGYRTAFVQLNPPTGTPAGNMWTNGEELRGQIDRIADHYAVDQVILVGHSKGGVDIDSAVVHYGAAPRVAAVFTLASPHWGTPLADLAYSWWGGWLAELLGQKDAGTYVIQTGYMRYFRSLTDGRPEKAAVPYYSGSGTNWGPLFSAMWFGGLYLGGSNDGLVPESSTHIPGGVHLFTRNWHHDNVRLGRTAFPLIEPYFEAAPTVPVLEPAAAARPTGGAASLEPTLLPRAYLPVLSVPVAGVAPPASPDLGQILRGGQIGGTARPEFPIEPGATGARLALLTSDFGASALLVTPGGQRLAPQGSTQLGSESILAGATAWFWEVAQPEAGTWAVELSGEGAYLLVTRLESPFGLTLEGLPPAADVSQIDLRADLPGGQARVSAVAVPAVAGQPHAEAIAASSPFLESDGGAKGPATLPDAETLNLAITLTGTTPDGWPFERNVVTSVHVGGDRRE